jgi:uncharacterized protein (DUF1330 family)
MKKGYWVVAYRSISNESALKAYAELALPAVESFGGRFLTRSTSKVQPHEVGLQLRTVVVEFDSYDTALSAHESEAYKRRFRHSAPERNATIVSLKECRAMRKENLVPGTGLEPARLLGIGS